MAVYDMDDALRTARDRHTTATPPANPTATSARYAHPIDTAHQSGLPIIDIASYLDPAASPSARQTTAQAINAACTTYGFFYLTGHGIPQELLDDVIALARSFFALSLAQKNEIKRFDAGGPEGGDSARGYQGLGENVTGGLQDMQEAVDFYAQWKGEVEQGDGGPGTRKTLQGENLWPREPQRLKGVYEGYVERVLEVGRALTRAMGRALELGRDDGDEGAGDDEDEDVFVRHCDDSFWVMRMINYPPLPTSYQEKTQQKEEEQEEEEEAKKDQDQDQDQDQPPQFSCGAHTDYGCVTLLLTDPTPGALQVQLKNGTWLAADPLPGAFVVNIGDMIERWTNGIWRSTLHRVVHRAGNIHTTSHTHTGAHTGTQTHTDTHADTTTNTDANTSPPQQQNQNQNQNQNPSAHPGRISVPFFFEPNFNALVRPLDQCVRRSGMARVHAGSTYGEHLLTKVFSNFYYSRRTDW